MSDQNITALRATLFSTLEAVKNGTLDIDRAKAINEVAKTIVETAKVEVDYLRLTEGGESEFIDSAVGASNLPPGITGIRQHRLK